MKFSKFLEDSSYQDIMSKNARISKKLWFGMPVIVTNAKVGKLMIKQPTIFYVQDFNKDNVTLRMVGDEVYDIDNAGEINVGGMNELEGEEFTISMKDFYDLMTCCLIFMHNRFFYQNKNGK